MGQVVAAMATVHAPQLFTRPPSEDPAQLDADIAAMRRSWWAAITWKRSSFPPCPRSR